MCTTFNENFDDRIIGKLDESETNQSYPNNPCMHVSVFKFCNS